MKNTSYLDFFGFKKEPFSPAPDEFFWYSSPQHTEAFNKIVYGVETQKGLIVVTGDIGLGKTTLARKLLRELISRKNFEPSLIIIIHSSITSEWFLKKLAEILKIDTEGATSVSLIAKTSQKLIEFHKENKITVFLIDEANMLKNRDVMEEIRGLLNIEVPGKRLINFVLFGLPELEINLRLDMPLYERVALRIKLKPFDLQSSKKYIIHRLNVAGGNNNIFSDDSFEIIHKFSRGKPRLINIICDNALLEAFLKRTKRIDKNIVIKVIKEMGLYEKR